MKKNIILCLALFFSFSVKADVNEVERHFKGISVAMSKYIGLWGQGETRSEACSFDESDGEVGIIILKETSKEESGLIRIVDNRFQEGRINGIVVAINQGRGKDHGVNALVTNTVNDGVSFAGDKASYTLSLIDNKGSVFINHEWFYQCK